ncbi:YtzH-like family protein [Fictibacillus iocasae]|uniref:YtzH-like family protein n=1 Tax=Fictibacillus iocasae TaxID=2715437 RepID=A0ABW2NVQ0_9BACL
MPLDHNHQLSLLRDILQDHLTDCNGSSAECAQLERLASSLGANVRIHDDIRSAMLSINDYSHTGISHDQLDEHIKSHAPHIEGWLDTLNSHHHD